MTVVQTLLVFIAIPFGIVVLIYLAVYGRTLTRQPNRYRPGRAWDYPPTWYVPHPDAVVQHVPTARAIAGASGPATTAVGGASGEW